MIKLAICLVIFERRMVIKEFIKAFTLIFAAEMGDKSQIIVMTFATLYHIRKVLAGVILGTFLNHSIAILLGVYIGKFIPVNYIQLFASCFFLIFGFLSLRVEDEEDINKSERKMNPIFTIAMIFFISELGDKTQLTTFALASETNFPLFTLMGTVLGMFFTSAFGIYIGGKLGEKIPEYIIKISSSLLFIGFGLYKLEKTKLYLNIKISVAIITIILFIYLTNRFLKTRKSGVLSYYKRVSIDLYAYEKSLNQAINLTCLTEKKCGHCSGNKCLIGQIKSLVNSKELIKTNEELINKFEDKDLLNILVKLLVFLSYEEDDFKVELYNYIRKKIEKALFNKMFVFNSMEDYLSILELNGVKYRNIIIDKFNSEIKDL